MGSFSLNAQFLQIFGQVARESTETAHFYFIFIFIIIFFFDADFLAGELGEVSVFCACGVISKHTIVLFFFVVFELGLSR